MLLLSRYSALWTVTVQQLYKNTIWILLKHNTYKNNAILFSVPSVTEDTNFQITIPFIPHSINYLCISPYSWKRNRDNNTLLSQSTPEIYVPQFYGRQSECDFGREWTRRSFQKQNSCSTIRKVNTTFILNEQNQLWNISVPFCFFNSL